MSTPQVSLARVAREWGRIGCIGFGGPPTHIKLLRDLCVQRQGWLDAREFEDAIAACNLLPGPASTQLAIFCAWRLRGRAGALVGGAAFILPGLIVILALAALFLGGSPPPWVLGAGAGAGAAVPAVAVQAGATLAGPSWRRRKQATRWAMYLLAGGAAAATVGAWLVLVLLGCGIIELLAQGALRRNAPGPRAMAAAPLATAAIGGGVLLSVAWVAIKVGALSFGGGFVIIPLMQSDAVSHYHWMTGAQFLDVVALGQITPGPVVQTVAAVGYAAAGLAGGLLAALVAFTPSFVFILAGARRFGRIRDDRRARGFLDGAGPAAIGAILGSAVSLTRELSVPWQYAVLAAALILLLGLRRGVVLTLLCAGAAGILIALLGGTLPALSACSSVPGKNPAAAEGAMAIDEATAGFMALLAESGAPPLYELAPPEARAVVAGVAEVIGPGPDVERVWDEQVAAADGGQFTVRVLVPAGDVQALLVYYHGGGWVFGNIDEWDAIARTLASRLQVAVLNVDYRLAPEHPFPAAVDDAWAALLWADEHMAGIAGGRVPLVVMGDSAGGNLAAVVARRARDAGGPDLACQVLVYPVTDADMDRPSYLDPENQLLLSRELIAWCWSLYAPGEADRLHPDASPLRAADLAGLAPAIMLTAEHDPLRDEDEAYAERLSQAGVPVTLRRFDGQMHAFFTMVNLLPGSAAGVDWLAGQLGHQLSQP